MPEDPLVGRTIGSYRILAKAGEGGMGAVYRAGHVHLLIERALKVLPERLASGKPEYLLRFHREALAAIEINHENVVRVFDAGEDGGIHYLVMEYVNGEPLSRILERRGALPELMAVDLAFQAAQGLEAAHRRGFVHRDVKPSNLMVTPEGVCKIADFGLAKGAEASAALSGAGEIIGSPYYMSPEQAEGRTADFRSDIYSLGVSLFEMLTGERPYRADTVPAVLRMHCDRPAPDPSLLKPGLDRALCGLVLRMTAKDPAGRFERTAALCDELRELRRRLESRSDSRIDSTAGLEPERGFPAEGASDREPAPAILPADPGGGTGRGADSRSRKDPKRKPSRRKVQVLPIGKPSAAPIRGESGKKTGPIRILPIEGNAAAPEAHPAVETGIDLEKVLEGPESPIDARGNPVVTREGARRDPETLWPWEIWLPAEDGRGDPLVIEFVLLRPGKFRMGSPESESGRAPDEGPVREVRIGHPFFLGKYEVTQAQWAAAMASNPSHFRDAGAGAPVENVSWEDCREFIAVLNSRVGATHASPLRLPSEAEWEYACRAGTRTRFSSGDSVEDLEKAGWFEDNSALCPHPVGRKAPNPWGLYDMHGNVWEWCEDAWCGGYEGAPKDGSAREKGGDPALRVLRGGSWDFDAAACRSANRYRAAPSLRRGNGGVRLALDLGGRPGRAYNPSDK